MNKHIKPYLKKINSSFNAALMTHHVCDGTCRMINLNEIIPNDEESKSSHHVFFCSKSGKVHNCGNLCTTKITKRSGVETCMLTGLVFVPDATSLVFQNTTIRTNTYDKKTHRVAKEAKKTIYDKMNKITYTLLYSQKRKTVENKRYTEACNEANKTIAKYKRQCEKKKEPKCLMQILFLYFSVLQKKSYYSKKHENLTHEEIKGKIVYYSNLVVKLWELIRLPVVFREFAVSMLYIFKRGVSVRGTVLIPKDYYLEECLPEANTLSEYGIVKPVFTNTKNEILKAIRSSIDKNTTFMTNFISIFE